MSQSGRKLTLEERVARAAETALSRQQYVSAIDVLCGMGLLSSTGIESWRKGRIDFLERVIQGNLSKISSSMAVFRHWAKEKGLKPSETAYVRTGRSGRLPLQFSKGGDPTIEKEYRTHYISTALSERKQEKLQEQNLHKTQQHQPQPDNRAQFGEQAGMSMPRSTYAQAGSLTSPVSIANGDFGSRYGWYVEIIKRKVSQNWNRYEVDAHTAKGATSEIYFRINRQGAPSSFKINTASGSPTLDRSCLLATQRVDTFGVLPPDSHDQWLDVTYDCTY